MLSVRRCADIEREEALEEQHRNQQFPSKRLTPPGERVPVSPVMRHIMRRQRLRSNTTHSNEARFLGHFTCISRIPS